MLRERLQPNIWSKAKQIFIMMPCDFAICCYGQVKKERWDIAQIWSFGISLQWKRPYWTAHIWSIISAGRPTPGSSSSYQNWWSLCCTLCTLDFKVLVPPVQLDTPSTFVVFAWSAFAQMSQKEHINWIYRNATWKLIETSLWSDRTIQYFVILPAALC